MSLIDQIRSQADNVRNELEKEQQLAQQREHAYRTLIIPRLAGLLSYFTELFDHLNLVESEISVDYKVKNIGTFEKLKQGNYLITADSNTNTKQVKITYDCTGETPLMETFVGKRSIEDQMRYMLGSGLKFTHKSIPASFRKEEQAETTIQPIIPVTIQFDADIEKSMINMSCSNQEGLGLWRRVVSPADIDESFCEDLGRYILRQTATFRTAQLNEETRAQLAEQVAKERAQRQQELDKAVERLRKEEEQSQAEAKKSGLFSRFKKA